VTRAEKVLLALLCAMAAFSPVFLGGVGRFEIEDSTRALTGLDRFLLSHGPYAILTFLAVATAGGATAVALERRDAGEAPAWRLHPGLLLPLGGLGVLALLQLVPLPRAVLRLLSPQAARQLEFLVPGDDSWRPISVSLEGTWTFLGGFCIGGAAILGTLLVARRRGAVPVLMGTLVAVYALVAAYGMWETWAGGNRVLGYQRAAGAGVSGTFVNRSHMAAAAGICLPLALSLGYAAIRRSAWVASVLAFGAAGVLALDIPLTHSRMGLAAGAFGLAVFGLLASRAVRWPLWARALLAFLALAVVGVGLKAAWDRVPAFRERFELARAQQGFFDVRFPAWTSTLQLASRYPVVGTGLGSYEVAIHETQSPRNRDEIIHAHSEPLEFLAEGGAVGFALAILVAFLAARGCLRLASTAEPEVRLVACACGGAMAALLAGCLTEFHLRIPALGIAAAILAGIPAAVRAAEPASAARRGGFALVLVAGLFGAGAAFVQMGRASTEGAAVLAEKGGNPATWLETARRAEASSGTAFSHRSISGALLAGEWGGSGFRERAEQSLRHADRAVHLEPFNAFSHWTRARALLALERFPEAAEAVARTRSRAGGIGHLLSACGTVLLELSARDTSLLDPALLTLREAGNCDPHYYSAALLAMDRRGLATDLRAEVIPELWYPLEKFLEDSRSSKDEASAKRLLRRLAEAR
jgi:O-antigen ligase